MSTTSRVARRSARKQAAERSGLSFTVAASLEDVLDAWTLVHDSYVRAGLIHVNPAGLHTVPHAVQSRSVVMCGRIGNLTVSTLSGYFDRSDKNRPDKPGLPLDAVYADELNKLRRNKRILMEIGLFADRREHIERSTEALLELMRYVCHFGVAHGATDGIIGVHPRHARFYTRLLDFDQIGPVRTYSLVKDHPVVLLRLDWRNKVQRQKLGRGLRYFRDNPVTAEQFAQRFLLTAQSIAGSPIEQFLRLTEDGDLAVG